MNAHDHDDGVPHLPPPTPWPMVMGLGTALIMAGLVVFLRGTKDPAELFWPFFGVFLFFLGVIMMLRDDVIAARDGKGH